jgi:hypothetical protein
MDAMRKVQKSRLTISRSFFSTLILAAFSLGIFIGSGVMGILAPLQDQTSALSSDYSDGAFRFIRPQGEPGDGAEPRANRELKPFRYKINALVEKKMKMDGVAGVSVYFRDLNNGNWFGIREKEKFFPRYNLKLPLMIAYFKQAESNPLVLRKSLLYDGVKEETAGPKHFGPTAEIEPGKRYAVNDLIFRMIAHDDPAAYSVLLANIRPDRLDKVFKDLYGEYDPGAGGNSLSLRGSAAFYRILFNASYLNEEMSEKALRYLSRSSFTDGMASVIPSNVDIASKFGECTIDEAGRALHQTHESGIIYHSHHPFLIGVMARGSDFSELTRTIRDVTRLVYDEVDRQS